MINKQQKQYKKIGKKFINGKLRVIYKRIKKNSKKIYIKYKYKYIQIKKFKKIIKKKNKNKNKNIKKNKKKGGHGDNTNTAINMEINKIMNDLNEMTNL